MKILFNDFWNLYDYKVDKKKCIPKWNRLKLETQQKIIDYLPGYIKSTPDKMYRKHPATFLNNESWENELKGAAELRIKTAKTEVKKDIQSVAEIVNPQDLKDILNSLKPKRKKIIKREPTKEEKLERRRKEDEFEMALKEGDGKI